MPTRRTACGPSEPATGKMPQRSTLTKPLQLIEPKRKILIHILFDHAKEFQNIHWIRRRTFDPPTDAGNSPFNSHHDIGVPFSFEGPQELNPRIHLAVRSNFCDGLIARSD